MKRRGGLVSLGTRVILGTVIGAAVVGRCALLCYAPVSTDESFSWRVLEYPATVMIGRVAEDGHAPLYFMVLKAYATVAGRSMVALRMFSLLAWCGSSVFCLAAMRQAANLDAELGQSNASSGHRKASLPFGELLLLLGMLALDPLQVVNSVRARMYPLGMLIFAVSTCLYLAALSRSKRNGTVYWLLWGAITGAGLLTHHFYGFAAAGQGLFALGVVGRQMRSAPRIFAMRIGSLLMGCLVALAVYSPWLPIILDQFQEVNRKFWIEGLTPSGAMDSFSAWLTGMSFRNCPASLVLVASGMTLGLAFFGVCRRTYATLALLCHALVPWVLCIALALVSGQSLLQDRYLIFGQASIFAAVGLGWGTLKLESLRWILGVILVAAHLVGALASDAPYDIRKDTFREAVEKVLAHDSPPKQLATIFVFSPAELNRTRYFLHQAGREEYEVLAVFPPYRSGHIGHIAALQPSEIYWTPFPQPAILQHGAWVIFKTEDGSLMHDLGPTRIVREFEFSGRGSPTVKALFIRSDAVPPPGNP